MTKPIELKNVERCACPFCHYWRSITMGDVWSREFWIKCARCGAEGPKADSIDKAIELWNNSGKRG